jgi:signal peptidase I
MRWFPVRVAGSSMEPTLRPGDLLAVRALREEEPAVGQIVVVSSGDREDVKRVTGLPVGGMVWVQGDNAGASTDSRSYGAIPCSAVTGVVAFRYWPLWRARVF